MSIIRSNIKLCYGVGINDSDTPTQLGRGKEKWVCPYYQRWRGILRRCYDEKYKIKYPTYKHATVCKDWLVFSNFRLWMQDQEWEGKVLDKDFIFKGNKVYSPSSCAFVTPTTNVFITNSSTDVVRGVCKRGGRGTFIAKCGQLGGKEKYLGDFPSEVEAFQAWKTEKHKLALILSEIETDHRIKESLRTYFI